MKAGQLEGLYGAFGRALSEVGEHRATLFLARFALLASAEIDDAERVRVIIEHALAAGRWDPMQ